MESVKIVSLCVIAFATLCLAVVALLRFWHDNRKAARLEGKMSVDSRRIIWRIVNTGSRDLTVVEIGIRCADKYASYRPLYSSEDVNALPQILSRGDIASYRKEMERFSFRPTEIDELKVSNPTVYFYAKDAEGRVYLQKSEYKFAQYLTMSMGGGK